MKSIHIFVLSMFCLVSAAPVMGQDKAKTETTITGELVDVKCYLTGMMGGRGDEHKQCATDCIKSGLPAGVLEEKTQKVYTIVPKKGMTGTNADSSLIMLIGERVTVTGAAAEKGGTKLFIYTGIKEAK